MLKDVYSMNRPKNLRLAVSGLSLNIYLINDEVTVLSSKVYGSSTLMSIHMVIQK